MSTEPNEYKVCRVEGHEIEIGQITVGYGPYVILPEDKVGFHAQVELALGPGLKVIVEDCDSDECATRAMAVARLLRNLMQERAPLCL
jgi:hypothetical protein